MKFHPQVTRFGLLLAPTLAVILCGAITFWVGKQIATTSEAASTTPSFPAPRDTATAPPSTVTPTNTPIPAATATSTPTPTPTAFVQPREIRNLSHLITADQEFQVWLTYEDPPSWWPFPFWTNKIILFATGSVQAGIDLGKLTENDLVVLGTKAEVTLPPPEFFGDPNLDLDKTKALEGSSFNPISMDWNKMIEAQREAKEAIRQKAIETKLLEKARTNAEMQVELLLRRLGATEVTIKWHDINY